MGNASKRSTILSCLTLMSDSHSGCKAEILGIFDVYVLLWPDRSRSLAPCSPSLVDVEDCQISAKAHGTEEVDTLL